MIEHEESSALKEWLNTDPGRYVQTWEYRQLNRLLKNVFGYHAIQIGLAHWDLLRNNRISHKWHTQTWVDRAIPKAVHILCDAEQLPFANESIDLLVLPHVLEMSSDPHQVLREVQRVLRPEAQVVITGFNPWSLWGLRERLPGLERLLPLDPQQPLSAWRVADWLELLSFEVTDELFGCYSPLCTQKKWLSRWRFMDRWGRRWWSIFGAVYVVKATKRVNSITMVGLDWSKQSSKAKAAAAMAGRNMGKAKPTQKN